MTDAGGHELRELSRVQFVIIRVKVFSLAVSIRGLIVLFQLSRLRRGGFFGLGRDFFAFDIALAAFSIFDFVGLSSHNSLHCSLVAVLWSAL